MYLLQPRLQLQQLCMCLTQDLLLLAEEEVERKDSMTVEDVVQMRVSYSLLFLSGWYCTKIILHTLIQVHSVALDCMV